VIGFISWILDTILALLPQRLLSYRVHRLTVARTGNCDLQNSGRIADVVYYWKLCSKFCRYHSHLLY